LETLIQTKPRLAFCGVGWIGRNRMQAVAGSDLAEILLVADTSAECLAEASKIAPFSQAVHSLDEIISNPEIDAVVIATPSAFHMEQSIKAFEHGKAVFCQKPLGRTSDEVRKLLSASKKANKLLGADFSYRYTKAFKAVHQVIRSGELGKIFAVDLKFHNAYGPDKPWFYDLALSGGGCVLDLGIHMIDLMLYALDFPYVENIESSLYSKGVSCKGKQEVEDFANVQIMLEDDISAQLSCSWNLKAGCDAIIEVSFYGTNGGVSLKNINGSFYDFNAFRYWGTSSEIISSPPDDWGGKAMLDWVQKLASDPSFDSDTEKYLSSSEIIDHIYGR
jgi:predicted dehydrogenase